MFASTRKAMLERDAAKASPPAAKPKRRSRKKAGK